MKKKNLIDERFTNRVGYYSLYAKSIGWYNLMFVASGDKDALNKIVSTLNADSVARSNAHDLEVYRVGVFDPETGIFDNSARSLICDNLLSIPSLLSTNVQEIVKGEQNE